MIVAWEWTFAGIGAFLLGAGSFLSGLAAYRMASKAVRDSDVERKGRRTDR